MSSEEDKEEEQHVVSLEHDVFLQASQLHLNLMPASTLNSEMMKNSSHLRSLLGEHSSLDGSPCFAKESHNRARSAVGEHTSVSVQAHVR